MDPRRLFVMGATAGAASRGSILYILRYISTTELFKTHLLLAKLDWCNQTLLAHPVGAKSEAGDVEVKFPKPLSSQLWNLPRRMLLPPDNA